MRILFVEDQRIFAETVASQFLSAHHVDIAESIAAARAALLASPPYDVALIDYDLPDGKGTALVRHLRATGFRGRIIAVSAAAHRCHDRPVRVQRMTAGRSSR
jgi:DNA-binding response OmpR family regulator